MSLGGPDGAISIAVNPNLFCFKDLVNFNIH